MSVPLLHVGHAFIGASFFLSLDAQQNWNCVSENNILIFSNIYPFYKQGIGMNYPGNIS